MKNMQKGAWDTKMLVLVAAVAAITIIAVLIFNNKIAHSPGLPTDTTTQKLESQSESDNVSDIQKDLNDTDFSDLDSELTQIDKELQN